MIDKVEGRKLPSCLIHGSTFDQHHRIPSAAAGHTWSPDTAARGVRSLLACASRKATLVVGLEAYESETPSEHDTMPL